MGKSLIIKDADFSNNGFRYQEVTKTITDLYNKSGSKVTDWSVQMSLISQTIYYSEKAGAVLGVGSNYSNAASTLLIDVEDYQSATVHTKCGVAAGPTVLGCAVMLFLDANQNVIGGYSTAPVGATNVISQGVGTVSVLTDFTKEIPSNCKYVVCTFHGADASETFTKFKLELKKYALI